MKSMKELYDECKSDELVVNGETLYKWKAWGYCSDCGLGSCKHLQDDL